MKSALLFVLLSGGGWVLDFCLFWGGVSLLALPPGIANFASATMAAMSVFLLSSRLIFRRADAGGKAIFVYLTYTEANIVVWAIIIQFAAGALATTFVPTTAALLAKIGVTPLSLCCNFLVTRFLAQRGPIAQ